MARPYDPHQPRGEAVPLDVEAVSNEVDRLEKSLDAKLTVVNTSLSEPSPALLNLMKDPRFAEAFRRAEAAEQATAQRDADD
jgi:hypothetical protein